MAKSRPFRVLHATDGSEAARAAMTTSSSFPWPGHSEARAIVVRPGGLPLPYADLWVLTEAPTSRAAAAASRTLQARWAEAEAVVRDGDPVDQILDEASQWGAHAVVLGWRGHGRFRRLLMGSVSRGVLRRAEKPVLVVRRGIRAVTRLVVGVDGSPASDRAVRFLARATVPKGGSITLVTVIPTLPSPSHPLLPTLSADVRADVMAQEAKNRTAADRRQKRAADMLRKAGWRVRGQVRSGAVLYELLHGVDDARADALVVGATSQSSTRQGLIGSTAEGAVNRSSVPVLVVP